MFWNPNYIFSISCFYLVYEICIFTQDAREAAIEEEQIGDIYFMYIERFLLMLEEEEENEEKKEKRRIQDEEITECKWYILWFCLPLYELSTATSFSVVTPFIYNSSLVFFIVFTTEKTTYTESDEEDNNSVTS